MSVQIEVATIVLEGGKVLLGKGEDGKWRVPGGLVDEFETCQNAAVRTFVEATGVGIKADYIIFVTEDIDAPVRHRIVIYAYGTYVEGEISQKMPTYTDIQWVDVRDLGALQNDMSNETIDSFYKFSLILHQQAAHANPAQA